jgi:Xaa-Pro aminopeptidase
MMPEDVAIYREKLEQVTALLDEYGFDAWLVLVRETSMAGDPALRLVAPFDLTWESALLVTARGERIAVVGRFDVEPVEASGLCSEVIGYDASIGPALREALARLDPTRIAIDYSTSDVAADGLTHGLYLRLIQHLAGTPYVERLQSAHRLLSALRARKTPGEQALLLAAAEAADDIFLLATRFIVPGATEEEIAAAMHNETRSRGLETSWQWETCPIVNTGPSSPVGHSTPTNLVVEPGHLVHIDFGVRRAGYCSDQQRMWYVDDGAPPPQDVLDGFTTVRTAIERAFAFIKPGVRGYEVDAVARQVFEAAGIPAYQHALGHGVGRAVHDGGVLLGPRWDRYGDTPLGIVEAGMVFTLECGAPTSRGYLGLEEEIVVEERGARWLAPPQTELWIIKPVAEATGALEKAE